MKRILFSLLLLSLVSLYAEPYELFRAGKDKSGHYGNVSVEKTVENERQAVRIRFGAQNKILSGAVVLRGISFSNIPQNTGFDRIVLTFKGNGEPGNFVLLLTDSAGGEWCWNGIRWQGSASISSATDFWQRRVFLAKDFKPQNDKAKGGAPDLHKLQNIQLAVGSRLKSPDERRADFQLASIALDDREQGGPVEDWNSKETVEGETLVQKHSVTLDESAFKMIPESEYRLPAWVNWDLRQAYRSGSALRATISLNNYWQFSPVAASDSQKLIRSGRPLPSAGKIPQGKTLYAPVPGTWDTQSGTPVLDVSKKRAKGQNGVSLSNFAQGWYRRALNIPESWKEKQILLQLDAVSDEARVFVNGIPSGDPVIGSGTVDISPYLKPGVSNDLAIFVQYNGFPFDKSHGKYEEFRKHPACGDWWFGWHNGPGLADDVSLLVIPKEEQLDDLRIVSSVKDGTLQADASFANRTEKSGDYVFRATVYHKEKEVLHLPTLRKTVGAGQKVRIPLLSQWEKPILWSPEKPELLRLVFTVSRNGKVLDRLEDRFGFRELTIRGADFYLNGIPRRLKFFSNQVPYTKMPEESIRTYLKLWKEMNFNGIIYESPDRRVVRIADEVGLLVAMRGVLPKLVRNGVYLPGVSNSGYPAEIYLSGKLRNARLEHERSIRGIVSKFRNNPSIVIWAINPLLCYNPEWINPGLLGSESAPNDLTAATLIEENMLRRLDPGRLVMQSMGANTGVIITANPYPTFDNQPDEWADWPLRWAEHRNKPLVLEEVALPFWNNFANWTDSLSGDKTSFYDLRQLYYEQAARYFGDSVYALSSPKSDDRKWNLSTGETEKRDGAEVARLDPAAVKTKCMYMTRCLRAWRMYGVSGIWPFEDADEYFSFFRQRIPADPVDVTRPGIKPEWGSSSPRPGISPVFHAMQELQKPFLAYIGGEQAHFTEQSRNFRVGESVEKQMLFSNDAPAALDIRAKWELVNSATGKICMQGVWNGSLPPGSIRKVPFRFRMDTPGEYELRFQAEGGNSVSRDTFRLTAFPAPERRFFTKTVRLYDTAGKTERLLKKLGVPFTRDLSAKTDTVVVGALSMDETFLREARKNGLKQQIRSGISLLVFAQKIDSPMKPYLEERRTRSVFVKDSAHPLLQGLPAQAFAQWRGEPDKTEPYPRTGTSAANGRFMHWGSRGTVATFVQDKPDSGRFRVLLDCDADLSRSALQENFVGDGRILFCMLDLEERQGIEPMADELAARLFHYLENPEKLPRRNAVFSGSAKTAQLLETLGFAFTVSDKIPEDCELLAVDSETRIPVPELRAFAGRGKIVLLLKPDAAQAKLLHSGLETEPVRLAKSGVPEIWKRGLGNSDFYFNPVRTLRTFGNAEILKSEGNVIALSALPEDFQQNSSVVKARRILSVLLTNLGVSARDAFSIPDLSAPRTDFSGVAVPFAIDPQSKGEALGWQKPEFDDSNWRKIKIGAYWETQGITMKNPHYNPRFATPYDGDAFYRIHFTLPPEWKGRQLYVEAGPIDDLDRTWFNGVLIGETTEAVPKYWELVRRYPVPASAIRWDGENVVAIRVRDLRYNGGIPGGFRITDGSPEKAKTLFYPVPSRLIYRFDPNHWRQW